MLSDIFRRASVRARIESNPLGAVLQDYVEFLGSRGHRATVLHQYVFAVEHFGRWVKNRPVDYAAVEHFIRHHLPRCRCSKPCPRKVTCVRAALRRLLEMLNVERPPIGGVIGSLLDGYEAHLRDTCGLARSTVLSRRRYARALMCSFRLVRAQDLLSWTPEQVRRYVTGLGLGRKPSSGQVAASGIRSFLRFLLLRNYTRRDLATAVPSFANWRLATLPSTVDADDLKKLVAAVDYTNGIGKRDRAILLCLTELGLRAVDVMSITIDDADLDAGILRVRRPKQREHMLAPMSRRLTSAIRSYLRWGRPPCDSSSMFVKHRAPVGESLKPIGIRGVVRRHAAIAGLEDRVRGTHVIRHSLATTLINAGAPMKEIADFLGHRCIDTTAIYAKVDLQSLRRVALPWPAVTDWGPPMKPSNKRVSTMMALAEEYLAQRRSLGFKLESSGRVLLNFAAFADRVQPGQRLTSDLAMRWATQSGRHSSRYRAARLSIVRGFARFLVARDGHGEIPGTRLLSGEFRRRQPHIYTDEQLQELLSAAVSLPPLFPLRPHVYEALFGLLASTGLRISEALGLQQQDVDLERAVLLIKETKFRKSRLVPLHSSVAHRLTSYATRRDQESDTRDAEWFLVGRHARPLPYSTVRKTFRKIVDQLGWKSNGTLPRPRIHDLRHTFACRRVLQWHRDGADVDHALASLSTYMGHGKLTDTYWYLSASGGLLDEASDRFERFASRKGGRP